MKLKKILIVSGVVIAGIILIFFLINNSDSNKCTASGGSWIEACGEGCSHFCQCLDGQYLDAHGKCTPITQEIVAKCISYGVNNNFTCKPTVGASCDCSNGYTYAYSIIAG